ncbi:MAG TPA: hypothetical protein VNA04_07030 [Thermoanaerobaculia bacterium]|nr:hypothetical protein [Thermoanaerobaculia bacterium]
MPFPRLVSFPILTVFVSCASSLQPVPETWLSVPAAPAISREQLRRAVAETTPARRGEAAPAGAAEERVAIVTDESGARLFRGKTPLTPPYGAIESFDVSLERREVIFSARRVESFDIGLVSLDGSGVNWVPEDPADELAPRWAPRGNKASFILRTAAGDLIRTVHIPTAVQLVVEFPFGLVRDFVWDGPAERFAVSWESAEAAPRIEVMRYGGEERRLAVPPAVRLDVDVAPFAGGLLLRPGSVSYGEKLPLVIWVSPGSRNAWNDARAALLQSSRVAALVVDRPPDAAVLAAIEEAGWVDRRRLYLVDPAGTSPPPAGVRTIRADPSVPPRHFRRDANVMLVDPSVVQSFAARFIADQLKGTSPSGHR